MCSEKNARGYNQSKRALNQAKTRERIVEATIELHGEVGPAATTISMIADRAGVQRHTVYAHFPDDRSLLMACSGTTMARDPLPSPAEWAATNDPEVRLRMALGALYRWYERNAKLMGSVVRDSEVHPLTREVTELRAGAEMRAIAESVTGGLEQKGKAALALAMSFHTWRTLTQDSMLDTTEAVNLMTRAIISADD